MTEQDPIEDRVISRSRTVFGWLRSEKLWFDVVKGVTTNVVSAVVIYILGATAGLFAGPNWPPFVGGLIQGIIGALLIFVPFLLLFFVLWPRYPRTRPKTSFWMNTQAFAAWALGFLLAGVIYPLFVNDLGSALDWLFNGIIAIGDSLLGD